MYLKPSPRLPMSSRGGALERERRGHRAVVAELLLDALEDDVPLARAVGQIVVRLDEEHRQAAEPGERIVRVLRVLGARDDEVVLAVPGGDEDLLPGDEPVAVVVLLAAGAQGGHVAAGVRAR